MSSESQPNTQQPQTSNNQQQGANIKEMVAQSNVDTIAYENGNIQKKVYGDSLDSENTVQLLFHLINRDAVNEQKKEQQSGADIISQVIRAQNALTFAECGILLEERLKLAMNDVQIRIDLDAKDPLDKNQPIGEVIKKKQGESQEVYLFYSPIKAIIKQKQEEIKYETINKYSFLDEKKKVKIYIELPDIGSLPEDKIYSRFLERSIELKIHGYKGKNWIFAVPRTQCMVRVAQSKIIQKKDKIIVSIGKMADADAWTSLYKVKGVGQKDVE